LAEVLVAVEASTDFSEEIGELDREWAGERIGTALEAIERLLATASSGRIMREGLRIAIVGPPNSGKSSLLNALLGSDRAIVTDIPGTTRDFVEESADLGGAPCVLIDTAGLRETADPVEALGVQRTRAQAANADIVWYVFDSVVGWTAGDESALASFDQPVTVLANKRDLLRSEWRMASSDLPLTSSPLSPLTHGEGDRNSIADGSAHDAFAANRSPQAANGPQGFSISAMTGAGLPELIKSVQALADVAADRPLINTRHEVLLGAAQSALQKAGEVVRADLPTDLLSTCLQGAGSALGQITGETASADMLEAVFSRFCIGK